MKTKCFDVLTAKTDAATRKYDPDFIEDQKKKEEIKEACRLLDAFREAFECYSWDVSVEEESREVVVTMLCETFEMWEDTIFKRLVPKADKMRFEKYADEVIRMDFIFEGLWIPGSK